MTRNYSFKGFHFESLPNCEKLDDDQVRDLIDLVEKLESFLERHSVELYVNQDSFIKVYDE